MTSLMEMPILLVDDDDDDRLLAHDALEASGLDGRLYCVSSGREALDFLRRRGSYTTAMAPRPGVILLDLNMPEQSGQEVLAAIKADSSLRQIPVVVMTTSRDRTDVYDCYDRGANSFITKPGSFARLTDVMAMLGRYWLQTVELPAPSPS